MIASLISLFPMMRDPCLIDMIAVNASNLPCFNITSSSRPLPTEEVEAKDPASLLMLSTSSRITLEASSESPTEPKAAPRTRAAASRVWLSFANKNSRPQSKHNLATLSETDPALELETTSATPLNNAVWVFTQSTEEEAPGPTMIPSGDGEEVALLLFTATSIHSDTIPSNAPCMPKTPLHFASRPAVLIDSSLTNASGPDIAESKAACRAFL
mmetsp:Transcript_3395/g.7485  ORF Transcript_3395/g.7485 Transcript_3395/m.7485 type:complete len:214 (-) Transcript_3395:2121-2762(-)